MNAKQERRRPRSRRVRIGLAGLVAALVVAVPLAWAGHDFADVPNGAFFHDEISAIKNAGITTGCGGGNYCPTEFVRRDAMAAFMHRGYGRGASADFSASPVPADYGTPVGTFSITPGLPAGTLPGAAGFIMVNAQVTIYVENASGCPCTFLADLWSAETEFMAEYPAVVTASSVGYHTIGLAGMGRITSSGAKQINVYVSQDEGTGTSHVFGQATAQYVPFGATGGNTIGDAGTRAERSSAVPSRPSRP